MSYDNTAVTADTYQDAVKIYASNDKSQSTNLNDSTENFSYWGYDDYNTSSVDPDKTRRVVVVPILSCTTSGGKSLYDVEDFACFFLLNKAPTNSNKNSLPLIGQRIENCVINNSTSSGDSGVTDGTFTIVLFKDPLNQES
jgi:hypothetical protein